MFCIISFIVLSILGIFSASNRQLAKEALDCVLRRVTFRPCNTGFDEKMKAKILGVVITRSEKTARFLNKHFEILAWIFFIALFSASFFALRGVYLFYTTGSCNGLNETGFCVFDPAGENTQTSTVGIGGCKVDDGTGSNSVTLDNVDFSGLPVLNAGQPDKIVFIGCYACEYSRKAYPEIRTLVDKYGVEMIYAEYPTKLKTDYLGKVGYCVYQQDPEKYWAMNDALFAADVAKLEDSESTNQILTDLGVDSSAVSVCVNSPQTEEIVQKQMNEILKTNFYGTPTIFINGTDFVGPKPYRVYAIQLKGLLYWLQ